MRLQVLQINCRRALNQSQECLALDLPCSSRLLVHGSPWPACHDLSASVSRMHACHVELSLDLMMFPIFTGIIRLIRWSWCWRQNAAGIWCQYWYNEKYWVVHCKRIWSSQFWPLVSVAVFHSHEHPRFEQSWRSTRSACVLSSNCTVANRSRSWTKTGAYSLICTATWSRLVACWVLDLLKVSNVSELNSPCSGIVHWSSRIHNKHTIFRVSGAFTGEWIVVVFGWSLRIFSPNSTLLCWYNLLVASFLKWLFLRTGRVRISLMRFAFLDNASRLLFFLSRIRSCTRCILGISWCVPPKRSIPILQLSVREFIGSESWDAQPWTFFPSEKQLILEYLLFSISRWGCFSPSACRHGQR